MPKTSVRCGCCKVSCVACYCHRKIRLIRSRSANWSTNYVNASRATWRASSMSTGCTSIFSLALGTRSNSIRTLIISPSIWTHWQGKQRSRSCWSLHGALTTRFSTILLKMCTTTSTRSHHLNRSFSCTMRCLTIKVVFSFLQILPLFVCLVLQSDSVYTARYFDQTLLDFSLIILIC